MGLRINTNTQSIAAQRNLGLNQAGQNSSLEKVSSGSRINKGADDAAGLAIATKMQASIRSLRQDQRNAQDGISMIQTAEGAMSEVGNILIRMRELSIQASSDTIRDEERGFVDKEVQALKSEISRIAQSTEYNGTKILNGESGNLEIQVGLNNNPEEDRFQYDRAQANTTVDRLGISDVSTASKENSQNNLASLDTAIKQVSENRSAMGALQNRMQSAFAHMQTYEENLSGARSRIIDTDMASETAELTKRNILSQAGTSVLSQANQNGMLALKLIG
jgi:flagellin